MEALVGASLFPEEHLADFALAYSFGKEFGGKAAATSGDGEKVEQDVAKAGGKKQKADASGGVYRGEKLKSYQGCLFTKLVELAKVEELPASPAAVKIDKRGKGKGREKSVGVVAESDNESAKRKSNASREQDAVLQWLPELLRLFVVCGRKCSDPTVDLEGLELAFGEQEVKSLIGGGKGGS